MQVITVLDCCRGEEWVEFNLCFSYMPPWCGQRNIYFHFCRIIKTFLLSSSSYSYPSTVRSLDYHLLSFLYFTLPSRPASWSSGQSLWLLIMRSRFYHGNFSLQGKIPVVTMVWVVIRFRLKAPPVISSSCISPLTSSGQRSRASCASQPQKSATLSPQPGGKPRKFIRTCGGIGPKKKTLPSICF